jgi:diketogulonate reductase-like aldo/keto reductase
MTNQPYVTLSNGIEMPLLGLGVYDLYNMQAEEAVTHALEIGYRLIDTAAMYNNETEIGNAVRKNGLPRNQLFITTKVANPDQGFDSTLKAFDISIKKLNMDYVDLYLVHWPLKGKRRDTWLALEKLYAEKKVRAIGVANYLRPFLEELSRYATIMPVLDQVEFTPWLFQKDLLGYCNESKIQLQSYCPLTRGKKFDDPRLMKLCKKHNKSPAQIILRWYIEHNISSIPKSSSKKRLLENFDVFNFSLSKQDVEWMDGFDEGFRICENPMDMF